MDSVTRYINIKGIKVGNTLVPIWDKGISFEKDDDMGEFIRYEHDRIYQLVECVYDLKTRTLSPGIEVDLYPDEDKNELKIGMSCFYETSHHKLTEVTITDIIFETYDMSIVKGKKMDKWYKQRFKDMVINADELYCIKSWKPSYVLSNGVTTEYTHELYQKA